MTGSSRKFDGTRARFYLNRIGDGWQQFRWGHREATRLVRERRWLPLGLLEEKNLFEFTRARQ
jgi:hypothetical protein